MIGGSPEKPGSSAAAATVFCAAIVDMEEGQLACPILVITPYQNSHEGSIAIR
jgi:hypothetical protein